MSEEKKVKISFWGTIVPIILAFIIISWIHNCRKDNNEVVRVLDELNGIDRMYKDDKERVAAYKKIDVSECPPDFREAFYRCVEAVDKYVTYRESGSFFHPIDNSQLSEYGKQVGKCIDELNTIAKKYANIEDEKEDQQ